MSKTLAHVHQSTVEMFLYTYCEALRNDLCSVSNMVDKKLFKEAVTSNG